MSVLFNKQEEIIVDIGTFIQDVWIGFIVRLEVSGILTHYGKPCNRGQKSQEGKESSKDYMHLRNDQGSQTLMIRERFMQSLHGLLKANSCKANPRRLPTLGEPVLVNCFMILVFGQLLQYQDLGNKSDCGRQGLESRHLLEVRGC